MNTKAGYEYLIAYKLTVPIYDLTTEFCNKYIDKSSRTNDQMVQAARSGMQNISEGYQHTSLKGYIFLCGIARGSLEELLNDYLSYARQHSVEIWPKEQAKEDIRELWVVWDIIQKNPALPDIPNFPHLPKDITQSVNLMLTLTNQALYLIRKLILSLETKHKTEGGLTERLYRERKKFRGY